MPKVEPKRTSLTAVEVAVALRDAWERKFESPVPAAVLTLLLTLADVETGDGSGGMPNCWHYNLGNLVLPDEYLSTSPRNWFVLQGDEDAQAPNEHHYKAFRDLADGAAEFIDQLTRTSRQKWWDGLMTGNPEAFVHALHGDNGGPRYFEASVVRYKALFMRRWRNHSDVTQLRDSEMRGLAKVLPVLRVGHAGSESMLAGALLTLAGVYVAPSLHYTRETANLVEHFQASRGLTVDGIIGRRETWPALLQYSPE